MSRYSLVCDGEVSQANDGAPLCSGAWALVEVPGTFELSQLDPVLMAKAFSFGFGSLVPVLVACFGVKLLILQLRGKN